MIQPAPNPNEPEPTAVDQAGVLLDLLGALVAETRRSASTAWRGWN
ncbi:MAG: hypothetical protein MUF32_04040 [Burkholderiaceae bacterium]|nr:hypothetical protein [Burkholderiaceae bacterium]